MSISTTSQPAVFKRPEYAKKTIDISKEDYFLFGSNVAFLTASALEHIGYSSSLLRTALNISGLVAGLGECLTTAPSFDHLHAALPGLALFGTRFFINYHGRFNPSSLGTIFLGIHAYGTYVLAKKAMTEAVKSYQLSTQGNLS